VGTVFLTLSWYVCDDPLYKIHKDIFSGSFDTAIKPNCNETLRVTAIFLFYFLQKFNICYKKRFMIADVVPSSQVRASDLMSILTAGSFKVEHYGGRISLSVVFLFRANSRLKRTVNCTSLPLWESELLAWSSLIRSLYKKEYTRIILRNSIYT
jgi:hypothetical protein